MDEFRASTIKLNSSKCNDYNLVDSYNIQAFDPKVIPEDITGGIIGIISPTGSGKSVILKDILAHTHKKYDEVLLMSGTALLQSDMDYFPRESIIDHYDDKIMKDLWDKQYTNTLNRKKNKKILVILDDIIHQRDFIRSAVMRQIATGSRHCFLTVYLLSQYIKCLVPIIRQNLRLLIAFEFDNTVQLKILIDEFLSSENTNVGKLLFKKITGCKYQAIVICMYKKGEPVEKKIYKYIADPNVKIDMVPIVSKSNKVTRKKML